MQNLFELSKKVKETVSNPKNILNNMPILEHPLIIEKAAIKSIVKVTKYLYKLTCPDLIFVSTVFNPEFSFQSNEYNKVAVKKCYDSIYFDIETH